MRWKFGWWRVVPGRLVLTGRRLDGAGRLATDAGTVSEYGPTGFVPSGVVFSDPGCWEITGRIGRTTLSFRTRVVIRRPHPEANSYRRDREEDSSYAPRASLWVTSAEGTTFTSAAARRTVGTWLPPFG